MKNEYIDDDQGFVQENHQPSEDEIDELMSAMNGWELSKYPTEELVNELLNRGDITFGDYERLIHHLETLMSMDHPSGEPYDETADIMEQIASI